MYSEAQLYICPRLLATGHFPKEKIPIFCLQDATQTCRHQSRLSVLMSEQERQRENFESFSTN